MVGKRRSTTEAVALWEEEEDGGWKCRKHPSQPRYGVCPGCLRDRLLLLCPECANARPCGCLATACSSSSSTSPFSSPASSIDLIRSSGGRRKRVGSVGPVARLIESEPAFRRSTSVGIPLVRSRSVAASAQYGGAPEPAPARERIEKRWTSFWPFRRPLAAVGRKDPLALAAADAKLPRSRSVVVGMSRFPDSGGASAAKSKGGWSWYFPSPMKAFRHLKSARVIQ